MVTRSLVAAVMLWTAAFMPAAGVAASDEFNSLLSNSPFGTPNAPATGAAAVPGAGSSLEFRGVMVDGGEQLFSVHDPASHLSHWVKLDEPGHPFKAKAYDGTKGALTVEYQGRTEMLLLKEAKLVAAPSTPAVRPPDRQVDPSVGMAPATRTPEETARINKINEMLRRAKEERVKAAKEKRSVVFPATPETARP